jgi:chemotaxis methyl-accepting protein methylase
MYAPSCLTGRSDLILCRNLVCTYFDEPLRIARWGACCRYCARAERS